MDDHAQPSARADRTPADRVDHHVVSPVTSGNGSPERSGDHHEAQAGGDDALEWSVWPLRENFFRSLAVILFLAAIVWMLVSWFGPQWIMPSIFILILFLSGFFLPTFYRLDSEQVAIRGLITRRKRRWTDLKRCYPGQKGVHLSPTKNPSRLENIRGLYLPFGPDPSGERRRQAMTFIEGKLNDERSTDRASGTAAGKAGP